MLRMHPAFEDQVFCAGSVGPETMPRAGGDGDGAGILGDDVFTPVFGDAEDALLNGEVLGLLDVDVSVLLQVMSSRASRKAVKGDLGREHTMVVQTALPLRVCGSCNASRRRPSGHHLPS